MITMLALLCCVMCCCPQHLALADLLTTTTWRGVSPEDVESGCAGGGGASSRAGKRGERTQLLGGYACSTDPSFAAEDAIGGGGGGIGGVKRLEIPPLGRAAPRRPSRDDADDDDSLASHRSAASSARSYTGPRSAGGGHLGLQGIVLPSLNLPEPGRYSATAANTFREPLQPRGGPVPHVRLPLPGELTDTLDAPPVPRGRIVEPLAIPPRIVEGEDLHFSDGQLAPRCALRGDVTHRSNASNATASNAADLTARGAFDDGTDDAHDEEYEYNDDGEYVDGANGGGDGVGGNGGEDMLMVRCTIVRDGNFHDPIKARHRPTRRQPLRAGGVGAHCASSASSISSVHQSMARKKPTEEVTGIDWKAKQAERYAIEAARRAESHTRAQHARKRLADAETALAHGGWAPMPPKPPRMQTIGQTRQTGGSARPPPIERPEDLPDAKETMAALRAAQRRLAKEIGALSEPALGGGGREKFAKTRLVTIRLVDERLAAEGRTPEHRDVIRLASAAGLRHPEALVWPGGMRVVFAEETLIVQPTPSSKAQSTPDGRASSRRAAIERLSTQLSELHGQQMAFFLALLDARLGFDTAASASVQRQADEEKHYHQVPPALVQRRDASPRMTMPPPSVRNVHAPRGAGYSC